MALRWFWVLKKQHARERVCCSCLDESQQNLCLRLHPEDLASEEGEEAWPEAILSFALKETARDARCHELLQEVHKYVNSAIQGGKHENNFCDQ